MSELSKRVGTAVLLLPLVAAWLFWLPSPWFDGLLGVFATLASVELVVLVGMPMPWVYIAISGVIWGLLVVGINPLLLIFVAMFAWMAAFLARSRIGPVEVPQAFGALTHAQWMMLWLFFFVWAVKLLHGQPGGIAFIAGACAGVWASDIAAYFVGRRFGRTKLCPAISPGKSIEGLMAAVPMGTAAAALVWHQTIAVAWPKAVGIGVVLVLAGIMGDLGESALKRAVGAKDSGKLLPGHGGLLDRVDALLPALPAAGLLWLVWR